MGKQSTVLDVESPLLHCRHGHQTPFFDRLQDRLGHSAKRTASSPAIIEVLREDVVEGWIW